jgi:hypothetical protein
VKRPDQTVFVYAAPADTVETIKTRLLDMTKAPFSPEHIKLVYNGEIMESSNPLSQYTSMDGDILHEIRCHGMFSTFVKTLFFFFLCGLQSTYPLKETIV